MIALGFFEPAIERFPTASLRDELRAALRGEAIVMHRHDRSATRSSMRIVADFPILAQPDLARQAPRLSRLGGDLAETAGRHRRAGRLLRTTTTRTSTAASTRSRRARPTRSKQRASRSPRFINADAARSSGRATRPRRSTSSRTRGGSATCSAGDAILTTRARAPFQSRAVAAAGREDRRASCASSRSTIAACYVLDDLDELLDGCKLVALAHVSNTLGTIAPLETIIPRAHAAGAVVLVDGAQGAPHMPVDVQGARRRFLRLQRAQDAAARPASACSTASARCSKRCRRF